MSNIPDGSYNVEGVYEQDPAKTEIVQCLEDYRIEAEEARQGGMNPRDDKWRDNLDLYWNRHDFSKKADWQAKEVMPEVSQYVDRFAGALKEALVATSESFYTVVDPYSREGDLVPLIKKITDIWLSTCGRNQNGHLMGFPGVFEEQMKQGALMACCAVVGWKDDTKYGRVAIEAQDPRGFWLDPTYRNLYRRRRVELDKYDLLKMVGSKDKRSKPLYDMRELAGLIQSVFKPDPKSQGEKEDADGLSHNESKGRRGLVTVDEYIATVVDQSGKIVAEDDLCVVANSKWLIRGPEKNPFWHGRDWVVYTPLITAPLSVYGRTYMEDFGSVARTFQEMTNMLLDAIHMQSMNAFAIVPDMLVDADQARTGVTPQKTFLLTEDSSAKDFFHKLEMGSLPQSSMDMWSALKNELSEAAGINEIGMGQFAPNSRTSATEINSTQESSSALIRSVAQTVEARFMNPLLDLVWKTGLQHMPRNDPAMIASLGEENFYMLVNMRKEFIKSPITFQCRGISALIQKRQMFSSLMQLLQTFAMDQNMAAAFMQQVDMNKLIDWMFQLNGIDKSKITMSDRDRQIQQLTQQVPQGNAAAPGAQNGAAQLTQAMGMQR